MATILFNPIGPPFDFSTSGGASGPVDTLTGNDGTVVNPVGNNIFVVGSGVLTSGISTAGNIYTTGSGATLTINETQAQFLTNYRQIATGQTLAATDFLVGCTASNITVLLPAVPGTNRIIILKDESGTATATPITINGNGKNINGSATYTIDTSFESANLYYNGTAWFSY